MSEINLSMPSSVETVFIPKSSSMKQDKVNAGVNDIWTGYVVTSDQKMVKAYVKKIQNTNELYKEILCSLLGRAIGINTPEPLIVKVDHDHPDIPNVNNQLFFGTTDCNSTPFSRFLKQNEVTSNQLLTYEDLYKIIVFDELIANSDRHPGNILFDGVKYDFIDHGEAFPINFTHNLPMTQCKWGENILAENIRNSQGYNTIKTHQFMKKVIDFISNKISKEQIKLLPQSSKVNHDELTDHHKNIQNFLYQRLPILSNLVRLSISNADDYGQLPLF
ncbi:HipA family kinase [Acinetobacter sp. TY1]|uniref:HipA family kinase n=1 Tax=Acinetobacter sp. TY1 TaxID=3387626 RepID=UPI003AF43958